MKLTTERLKQIIKEEIEEAIKLNKKGPKLTGLGQKDKVKDKVKFTPPARLVGEPEDEEGEEKSKPKMNVQKGIERTAAEKAGKIAGDDYMDRLRGAGLAEDASSLEERIFKILVDKINGASKQ